MNRRTILAGLLGGLATVALGEPAVAEPITASASGAVERETPPTPRDLEGRRVAYMRRRRRHGRRRRFGHSRFRGDRFGRRDRGRPFGSSRPSSAFGSRDGRARPAGRPKLRFD
jgi:hypothetical protein